MHDRDYRDIIGAAVLISIGAFVAAFAFTQYSLGTVRRMGPGMFPTTLGVILLGLGIMMLISALRRRGAVLPKLEIIPLVAVLASGAFFALTISRFGLVVATMGMSLLASLANGTFHLRRSLILAVGLTGLAILIFKIGLGLQVHIVNWPV